MDYVVRNSIRGLKSALILFLFCGIGNAVADDWNGTAQQLARKIVAVTGPGAVTVTVENRSSLAKKDVDAIGGLLLVELEALGARAAKPEQAAAVVAVWLSENPRWYVWVAEIHQGGGEASVVMVSMPHGDESGFEREAMPVSLRKIPLWEQEDRILDVLVLEEDTAPRHIAVLDGGKVAIYRLKNGKWQLEQSMAVTHGRPWPRDLRGRVMAAKDHLLDVYLPGVFCKSTTSLPLALNCRETDDPWPLMGPLAGTSAGSLSSFAGGAAVQPLGAFYSATRNFFTGALTPGVGELTTVEKFYSVAPLPRGKYVLWLFAGTDGEIHLVDGMTDQTAKLGWGSDIASLKTACGAGWQVLAASAGERGRENGADSVRAYEIADRDPVPVSAGLDFSGGITALWTEAKGDGAIAVVRNFGTGEYEAFRLATDCSR